MTRLAQLVVEQTAESLHLVVQRHVDGTAEAMARELLSDAAFRAEMKALFRQAFRQALDDLTREPAKPRRGGAK